MRGFQTPRYLLDGSLRLEDLRVMVPSPDDLPERAEERIDEGPAYVSAPVRPHVALHGLHAASLRHPPTAPGRPSDADPRGTPTARRRGISCMGPGVLDVIVH